jgi:predicted phosphodiesterase
VNLSDLNVRRVLVVGDMHGNLDSWESTIIPAALAERADIIVQVGDFGFGWNNVYLDELDELIDDYDAPEILWLDGNHENFDLLETVGAFGAENPTPTSEHTTYLPRGYRWTWQGVPCMALGGAYSVDKPYRTEGASWWRQEQITDEDKKRALTGGPVDVLFAHDCYDGILVPGVHAAMKQGAVPYALSAERAVYASWAELSKPNRQKLRTVVRENQVQMFIHGHFHVGYAIAPPPAEFFVHDKSNRRKVADLFPRNIIGLNRESDSCSMIALHFPTLDWEWVL